LLQSNGISTGGFEKGINPALSKRPVGSLSKSKGFDGNFPMVVLSDHRSFSGLLKVSGRVTGWENFSLSAGKGTSSGPVQETATMIIKIFKLSLTENNLIGMNGGGLK
jgi:hypothetical protein